MEHLGKILPIDGYQVLLQGSLPTDYLASLTHLYQPLLGIEAISLYHLLIQEKEMQDQTDSMLQTHHTLMNYLNLPLDQIYGARIKLEGIGLLKTYKQEKEDKVSYLYKLIPPFRPVAFFEDLMLAELLYRQIGRVKFTSLQAMYGKKQTILSGVDMTATFTDVFQTFQPHGIHQETPTPKEETHGIPLKPIDFTILSQTLKRKMIPVEKALSERNRRIITQLQQLYHLEMYELEQAINSPLTDENELDIEQLQAACEDLFRDKAGGVDIKLAMKQLEETPKIEQVTSEMDQSLHRLATISTKELLDDLSVGDHAGEQDLKMVSEIMIKQGIPTQVMNVLVTYVMHQTNNQLARPYLEKIASHWSRLKFKTAKQAMDYILHPPEKKSNKQNNNFQRKGSSEIIPEWFKERKQQAKQPEKQQGEQLSEQEKRAQEEMIALLEKYDSKDN